MEVVALLSCATPSSNMQFYKKNLIRVYWLNSDPAIDGSCNHLSLPWLGAAMTPFRRLLSAVYGPDMDNMNRGLRVATDGSPLPNARFLSNELSETTNGNSFGSTSSFMSVYVMQMGQFLDHDFAHAPNPPQVKDSLG